MTMSDNERQAGPSRYAGGDDQLRAAIRKCRHALCEAGRRDPRAAFGEFAKLTFIKQRCEQGLHRPQVFRRRRGETADRLSDRINALYEDERRLNPGVFTESIKLEPSILAQCVEHLECVSLSRAELDATGIAYEEFMDGRFTRDSGQYFTPRELAACCVAMLDPEPHHLILDPSCGSGRFLLYAQDHLRRRAFTSSTDRTGTDRTGNRPHGVAPLTTENLFGLEINEELVQVARMNLIAHRQAPANIAAHDALDFAENIQRKHPGIAPGRFDLVLANPPFGTTVKRAEKGDGYLEQFDLRRYLGRNFPNPRAKPAGVKAEVLFLERIHAFLKPGSGRAAVILPDSILSNAALRGVRRWLLEHFQLLAVVSLPQFAFGRYHAGVKASIVLLRRLADGEAVPDDSAVFMALAENIGYDAIGHTSFEVSVEEETAVARRVERHRCDLFDYRVVREWVRDGSSRGGCYGEGRRMIIPGTGLLGEWENFKRDPTPFFT